MTTSPNTIWEIPITFIEDIPSVPKDNEPPRITWQEYYSFRNVVLSVCRQSGTVGPMGETPITNAEEGPPDDVWHVEDLDPDFFVVDDFLNDWERHVRIETNPNLVSAQLLSDPYKILREHPAWSVGLATGKGYMLLTLEHIWLRGPLFAGSRDLDSVLAALAADTCS